MATGSWLKANRKQLSMHSLIIVGFVLFTVLAAEPLFERLEAVQGESNLCEVSLPAETEGLEYYFDEFVTDGQAALAVRGWAFIDGEDADNTENYIVLKSARRTYVFDTMVVPRPDVTLHFEELGLNLDYSGFSAVLPARKIADGEYNVGIYIRKGEIEALQYTSKHVVKSRGTIELTG